ncbi:hypothetical protein Nepgr_028452 [Nepenthes gracilis]|uniref:AP2/ERF domain-containing protein n=1 Tax=Nepenthes gracilis TaxID=150966 RepID=A0AAD3Y451_NEPGR|nr:hypothetical protein Nepgr_028452 [Nepenthes gracilis]
MDFHSRYYKLTSHGFSPRNGDACEASSSSLSAKPEQSDEVILAMSRPKRSAGRKKFKETRHPVYRGVRRRNGNKWVCELRTPNSKSRIWLGTYPTAEMAARAHDVAALALRGRLATINFADSMSILTLLPDCMSVRDIQRVASEVAEAFRPQESSEESVGNVNQEDVSTPEEVSVATKKPEIEENVSEKVIYMDEEAVFNMPRLLADMAEGLLLSPPHYLYSGFSSDETEGDCEVSIWSFPI